MVTPFIIDNYSLCYSDKGTLISIFIDNKKVKIPKLFKKNDELFLYLLKTCGLTEEIPDPYIWNIFTKYILLQKIKIEKLLDFITEEKDKFETIEFLYNKII